jgi:hypothetical protein
MVEILKKFGRILRGCPFMLFLYYIVSREKEGIRTNFTLYSEIQVGWGGRFL